MAERPKKTTMSVREMREMLGLGKTDSYWLLKKKFFDVVLVNGKMRVVIESFENWYANQVKYSKVNGPPPGEKLNERSYSIVALAEMLGVSDTTIYDLIKKGCFQAELVDYWTRVPKQSFGMLRKADTGPPLTVKKTESLKKRLSVCRKWPVYWGFTAIKFIVLFIVTQMNLKW